MMRFNIDLLVQTILDTLPLKHSQLKFKPFSRYSKVGDAEKCVEEWPDNGSRIYTLALFSIQYAIPLTLIAVLYSISWNQIRKKNRVIIRMQELQQKGKCHFSRSSSWDVSMKKSQSFPSTFEGS